MVTRPKILIVEDDQDCCEALSEVLVLQGYDAMCVRDGREALAQLRREPFDVLVVDLGLADVTGLDVLRAARALPDAPPIVVFTGHHRLKADAEAAGCEAFVLKPALEELLACVGTLIAARLAQSVTPARKDCG